MLSRRGPVAIALLALALVAGCSGSDDTAGATPGSPPGAATSTTPTPTPTTPTTPTHGPGGYVALGDSYTAAPGVPDTEQQSGCFRSSGNYPSLVAARLGTPFVDASCSGASTLSLVGAQQTPGGVQPAQFSALRPDTAVVTLQIGGNDDALFQTLVGTCTQLASSEPDGSPCRDRLSAQGDDQLEKRIRTVTGRVTAAIEGVHDRSPDARVLLVGYPQPVPATRTCEELPLASGDYAYVRDTVVQLGAALQRAAGAAGATYVDLLGPSEGHDICAGDDAWIQGRQTDITRAIAFHPFAAEQQAVADLILEQLG